jgi:hypothetical protein
MRDNLIGLHKLPLACDIETEHVLWPAKQTLTVETLDSNNSFVLDTTYLPVVNINTTSKVHDSLRDLIRKISTDDPFTIDFDSHGLTLEQISTYSIYAQTVVTIIVVINSLVIGFLCLKWIFKRRRINKLSHDLSLRNKFRGFRDSVRSKKNQIRTRGSFRNLRDSFRAKRHHIKKAVTNEARNLKHGIQKAPELIKQFGSSLSLHTPSVAEAGTNTNINWDTPSMNDVNHVPVYPALPRYI